MIEPLGFLSGTLVLLLLAILLWQWYRHRRLQTHFSSLPDALLLVGAQGLIVQSTPRAEQLLGYPRQVLEGMSVEQLLPNSLREHHSQWRQQYHQAPYLRRMSGLGLLSVRCANGEYIEVDLMLSPTEDQQVWVSLRPTASGESEPATWLRSLNQLPQTSAVGAWEWPLERAAPSWSPEVYQLLGLPVDEPWRDYTAFLARVHPEDQLALQDALAQARQEGRAYESEYRILDQQGQWRYWRERNYLQRPADGGSSALLVGTISDLTELRQAQRQLHLSQLVFEHCAEGVAIANLQGQLEQINPALRRMIGLPQQGEIPHDALQLAEQERSLELLTPRYRLQPDQQQWQGSLWLQRLSGERIPVSLSVQIARDRHGEPCNYVMVFSDISRLHEQQRQLEYLALHDPLTGLPNRTMLFDRLQQQVVRARRRQERVVVGFIDLDGFKSVNDQLGHEQGDQLLKRIARAWMQELRGGDTLARIGGDEFALLLPDCDPQQVDGVAVRLLQAARMTLPTSGLQVLQIGASIGFACFPEHAQHPDELILQADRAMYRAKQQGRGRWCWVDEGLLEPL